MADSRSFEARLQDALVRYVSDGGAEFDAEALARTIARGSPSGRPAGSAADRIGAGRPRRLILLVAAGLVLAVMVGTVLIGSGAFRPLVPIVGPNPTPLSRAAPSPAASTEAATTESQIRATCRGFPGVDVTVTVTGADRIGSDDPDISTSFAAFSDDGSTVTYWTGWPDETRVYVADADGANPREFPDLGGDGGGQERALSPDGRAFAWFDRRRPSPDGPETRNGSVLGFKHPALWITPTDGGPSRRLTSGSEILDDYAYGLTWSPDGRSIAFAGLNDRGDGASRSAIYVVDLTDGTVRRLTARPGTDTVAIAWSPDGRRLAYLGLPDDARLPVIGSGTQDIFVVDADGSGDRRITDRPGEEGSLIWSPDGTRLAYLAWDGSTQRATTIDVGGPSTSARPRTGPAAEALTWSPDGSSILYLSGGLTSTIDAGFQGQPDSTVGSELACSPWPAPTS